MGMTDLGRRRMLDLLIGAGGTNFAAATSYLAVGTSSAAFVASQTALQAGEVREITDTVSRTTDTLTAVASFETADANQVWAEVGWFDAATTGLMLSRFVAALGTKASGTWTLTYTLAVT